MGQSLADLTGCHRVPGLFPLAVAHLVQVRYRFQLACGADQVTGLQGDCWSSQSANIAQATAQATAATSGMAVATATAAMGMGTYDEALPSCVNIGTDINAWRRFHNPDTKTLRTANEHFRVTGETNVDMSDPTFAAVSRAYMSASTSWRFYQSTTQLNFPYGYSNTGVAVNTGATSGAGAVVGATSGAYVGGSTATAGATAGTAVNTGMNYGASSNASSVGQAVGSSASASASSSATSGASSSASASASSTTNTSSYMPNRFNFLWGK